jgi:dolichol-phosphate mannosyltransferase
MQLSIVIPMHNEQGNVAALAAELGSVQPRCPEMEVLLVDDGSTDKTQDEIQAACRTYPFIRAICSPECRGQSATLLRGLKSARGEIIVLMDGDLQNDPADIPKLLASLPGFDAVCGYRATRKDSWSRRVGSQIANAVRNMVTHDGVRDAGCSLKAFRRECVDDFPPLNGFHRFIPAYFRIHGRKIVEVPVNHRPRRFGASKYTNLKRLPRTLFDLFGFVWYRKRLLTDVAGPADDTNPKR